MINYKITYRYAEINNAFSKNWNSNFSLVEAETEDQAKRNFLEEWNHELSDVEILDCVSTGSQGGAREGAGNKKGSKRVDEVKVNTTVKVLHSKKTDVMNKAKELKDGTTLGSLLDSAMDEYLAR